MDIYTEITRDGYKVVLDAVIRQGNDYYVIYELEGNTLRVHKITGQSTIDIINNVSPNNKIIDEAFPIQDIKDEIRQIIDKIYKGII